RERGSPEQLPGGILQPGPLEVALTEEHGTIADPSQRTATGVFDHGVVRVEDACAKQPRAVREIDVLVDHEEVLVEPLEGLEQGAPDEERAAARAEHFAGR